MHVLACHHVRHDAITCHHVIEEVVGSYGGTYVPPLPPKEHPPRGTKPPPRNKTPPRQKESYLPSPPPRITSPPPRKTAPRETKYHPPSRNCHKKVEYQRVSLRTTATSSDRKMWTTSIWQENRKIHWCWPRPSTICELGSSQRNNNVVLGVQDVERKKDGLDRIDVLWLLSSYHSSTPMTNVATQCTKQSIMILVNSVGLSVTNYD